MSVEDAWVFDSLLCFLHGPIWNAPLQTFIEEKSIMFDPNLQTEEATPEINKIHVEYKNLVDYMLGSFMEEMQITPEQFEDACLEGRNQQSDNPFQLHQGLFQQIWAANDIKIFMRMMTQRNIELQLQALDLIEKNQLTIFEENQEEKDKRNSIDPEFLEETIAKSLERNTETPDAAITPDLESVENDVVDKFERLNLFFDKNDEVSPNDVVSRQEYLRQQRDKIIEIKKKTRSRQLQETISQATSSNEGATAMGRPSSAQIAQKLLENGGHAEGLVLPKSENTGENIALEFRKNLAKRLRSEVVENN